MAGKLFKVLFFMAVAVAISTITLVVVFKDTEENRDLTDVEGNAPAGGIGETIVKTATDLADTVKGTLTKAGAAAAGVVEKVTKIATGGTKAAPDADTPSVDTPTREREDIIHPTTANLTATEWGDEPGNQGPALRGAGDNYECVDCMGSPECCEECYDCGISWIECESDEDDWCDDHV